MNRQLDTLKEIILLELRVQRRNPIWIISIAAAALLGFSESFTVGVLDWPTTNQAFRAYQLGSVMIFSLMTFLLTAGSFSRDLSDGRKDLLLCRPISHGVYVCGKYIGNVSYSVPLRETKLSVLLAQLEMFAPLTGFELIQDIHLSYRCKKR